MIDLRLPELRPRLVTDDKVLTQYFHEFAADRASLVLRRQALKRRLGELEDEFTRDSKERIAMVSAELDLQFEEAQQLSDKRIDDARLLAQIRIASARIEVRNRSALADGNDSD